MNTAVANPMHSLAAASSDDLKLKKFLIYSLICHALLALSIVASIYIKFAGEQWGGAGGTEGSVQVKLSGPLPGIPLPPKRSMPDSATADPSETLFKEEPTPKPLPEREVEPKKPVEKIQKFKNEQPLPQTHKSKIDQSKTAAPDNAVPGKGSPPKLPTNYSTQPPGGGAGNMSVQAGQGGGDFALKYPWYVESVIRRINQNWEQSSIDPAVRAVHQAKTVVTFRIFRDGSVRNISMSQSSGNLSMDNSARRALDGIQFGPLPYDFNGDHVDVTFDFDLALPH